MEKRKECDCCGYETGTRAVELHVRTGTGYGYKQYELCDICFSTFISNAISSESVDDGQAYILKSLGWIANKILEELGKQKTFTE